MKSQLAVIDVGSNSVRLMIAAMENGRARSILKTLNTTRLAKGIDRTHNLAEDRMEDTVHAIGEFAGQAFELGIPVIAYATSAVRDADNREAFLARVSERTGVRIRVLSGEQEGYYAFSAVTGGAGTVFDIGGGSFQIVTHGNSQSVPCGCVRAKERCDVPDPKVLTDELFRWIDERACVPETVPAPVYGVGGTITTIGALLRGQTEYDSGQLKRITLPELDDLIKLLCAVPEEIRMRHPLLKRRGDVILQGATILRYMMIRTHTDAVIPSDRDGMEGIAEAYFRDNTIFNESYGGSHEKQ